MNNLHKKPPGAIHRGFLMQISSTIERATAARKAGEDKYHKQYLEALNDKKPTDR